ncbi:BamA/TamA family outer membrane protein [Candidatus Omnitrophota bacterium]
MLRSLFVTVLCVLAVVPAGAGEAHAKLQRKKTEMNEQSADQISKIRFRDLVRTNLDYKGIPGAEIFTIEFTKIAKSDNEEDCIELLDMLDLDFDDNDGILTVRLHHPKYHSDKFWNNVFNRKEWDVTLKVTGPAELDMDVEASFSTVDIEKTEGVLDLDVEFSTAEARSHTGKFTSTSSFSEVKTRDLDGSFTVKIEFGHVQLRLARLGGDSSARTSFGKIDIQIPRNTGVEFHVDKSFGGVDFDVSGDYSVRGEKGQTRILNGGGPVVDLGVEFGGIAVRNNLGERQSAFGQTYVENVILPLKRKNWWRYADGEKSLTISVKNVWTRKSKKISTLRCEGTADKPFESIDVCETSGGLYIAGIDGDFFGKDMSGLQLDPPRLWLPYGDSGEEAEGDRLFGSAVIEEIAESDKQDTAWTKAAMCFRMQTEENRSYVLTLVPGVGFTSFGGKLKLVDYNLEGVRPKKPAAAQKKESPPPPPPFVEGEIVSLNFRGMKFLPKSEVEKLLSIEKGARYTREEISDAVDKLPGKSKFINGANYTIDKEGNLKVRIHEAELYSWDWDAAGSFSRVAGLGLGPKLTLSSLVGPFSELTGSTQYHWGNRDWTFTADAYKRFFKNNRLAIGATYRLDYESSMEWAIPKYDSYLNAFIAGLETTNYYKVEGASGYISQSFGNNFDVKVEYFEENFESIKKHTNWSVFNQRHKKEDNPLLSPGAIGNISGARLSAEYSKKYTVSSALFSLLAEQSYDRYQDSLPEYTRFLGNAVYSCKVPYRNQFTIRIAGGYSDDVLPEQKAFRLGGLNTLRGFDFGSVPEPPAGLDGFDYHGGGNRMFLTNIDYFLGSSDEFRMVLFGDVGGVWQKGESVDSDDLKRDVGVGFVFSGDIFPIETRQSEEVMTGLRINWAIPVGPEPHVSHWTVNFVRAY